MRTRYLPLQILLLTSILWECHGVLGPGDYAYSHHGMREEPICLRQCYCAGSSVECNSWSEDANLNFLPRTTTALSIRNFPDKIFNTTIFAYVQDIQWLRLSQGRLEYFPDVSKLTKLSFLDLSENNIENLSSKPVQILHHMTHLNLSSNRLEVVNNNFLQNFPSLRIMDMSDNPLLQKLPDNLLDSNRELNYLDLSNTNLLEIPSTLMYMPNLYYLNLSRNSLTSIPEMNLPFLEILDISHNPLISVPGINMMSNLKRLFVSHTNIEKLVESSFMNCHSLKILDIRASNLINLDRTPFRHCRNLEELNFSFSLHLRRIEEEVFDGLVNLRSLFLDNSPSLHEMERDIMNGVGNLKELNLQNSGLEVLPKSLQNLTNLTVINIKNTVIKCNCNAYWLTDFINRANTLQWQGIDPIACKDGIKRTSSELERHLEALECAKVEVISPQNEWILAPWGQSALLDCNATGSPSPNIIWQTSQHHLLMHSKEKPEEWEGHKIKEAISKAKETKDGKYQVLQSGKLLIKSVQREDIGRYKCFAYNSMSNASAVTFLGLQDTQFRAFVHESLLFGLLCAALFLFITLLIQFIKYVMDRLGCQCCCCCKNRLSPKAKQIRQLLESVESYKTAQLEKLRENYNSQVVYIKDSCYQQMERIRDSYAHQSKNLRDLRDYSTQQLSGARDQYVDQVNKVRDYSLSQMNRVRENYVFQRQRIRKFSAHQLLKFRETYKYQQKTLNKILETLPDFYIQNCRTGSCQRTDSIIFDELEGLDVYYKIDFLDNISTSDYYTPNSTLTRHSKGNKSHSRNQSATSEGTEYLETYPWISRQGSLKSEIINHKGSKLHGRSLSLATPPPSVHRNEGKSNHKRSLSASQPKQALVEEPSSPISSPQRSLPESTSHTTTPLYTPNPSPISLTPEHKRSDPILEIEVQEQPNNLISPPEMVSQSDISPSISDISPSENSVKINDTSSIKISNSEQQTDAKNSPSYETSL